MEITEQTTLFLERSRTFKESPPLPGRFPGHSSDLLQVQGRVPGPPRWEPASQVSLLPHQSRPSAGDCKPIRRLRRGG